MSKLSRLQTRLTKIQARLSDIEAAYPRLALYKQYSQGFGQIQTGYQEFGQVALEYHRLLQLEESLQDRIAELTDAENTSTYLAHFRRP